MTVKVNYGNIITEVQMQPDEIEYICNLILNHTAPDFKMLEFGSGGSTCKWLETMSLSDHLVSIEHTESWYNRVTRAVNKHFDDSVKSRFTYLHVPEQYMEHGYATPQEEHPIGLGPYINAAKDAWDADVFFIDGIGRAACALAVLAKSTKPDPVIMIHDAVGREQWYDWVYPQFSKVEQVGSTLVRLWK